MRIISQDRLIDLPYETSHLVLSENENAILLLNDIKGTISIGTYETLEKATMVFEKIRHTYSIGNMIFLMPLDEEV